MNVVRVRLGYFEDFKSNDTILMEADTVGLQQLAEVLRSIAAGTTDVIAIHTLPFVEHHHAVNLIAVRGRRDIGALRGKSANNFCWERTNLGWQDAADKVEVLSRLAEGHHYLEAMEDEVVVQVSKGEYGDDWWLTHG